MVASVVASLVDVDVGCVVVEGVVVATEVEVDSVDAAVEVVVVSLDEDVVVLAAAAATLVASDPLALAPLLLLTPFRVTPDPLSPLIKPSTSPALTEFAARRRRKMRESWVEGLMVIDVRGVV